MMSDDDNDGQMIFGDLGGLKLSDICLTGKEKPRKNLTQETCPDRGSNPGPLRDKRACCRLAHSGGHSLYNNGNSSIMVTLLLLRTHKFRDSRNREKFKNSRRLRGTCFKIKLNKLMWVLTRELLANFCKSAYIREFLILFAKFMRI